MANAQLIRLMDEAPFMLGGVTVTPAARTLSVGERVFVLEPRVMQVLVTLARQPGTVVGRETLIESCWGRQIVGEDSINRAILKLRRVLQDVGGIAVDTVPKVGYRLDIRMPLPAGGEPSRAWAARWPLFAIVGALTALTGAGLFVLGSHRSSERTRVVVVQPLTVAAGDLAARQFSQDLASDLSRAVLGHDAALDFTDSRNTSNAAFTVTGSVATIGKDLHAVVAVKNGNDPVILWSHDYTAPLGDLSGLRQQVSTNLAAVLVCATGTRGVPDQIDSRATALYLEACNLHSGDQRRAAYLLRQVTKRAPLFAGAWSDLAISLAFAADEAGGQDADAARREAGAAARRAMALDPRQGNAYYASALLLPGIQRWVAREHIVTTGLEAQPDNPQLYTLLSFDLAAIGRQQDGIAAGRRAVALDPLFPGKTALLIRALANAGELQEANDAVRTMQETWPNNPYTWHARFETAARIGDPREAEGMLDDRHGLPFDANETAAWRIFLQARASPSKRNVDAAIDTLLEKQRRGADISAQIVSDLTLLGHWHQALEFALRMPPQTDSDFWFRSFLKPLRADPRFMIIAEKQGVLAVWRATGMWPDFCLDRTLPYDCRAVASQLRPLRG